MNQAGVLKALVLKLLSTPADQENQRMAVLPTDPQLATVLALMAIQMDSRSKVQAAPQHRNLKESEAVQRRDCEALAKWRFQLTKGQE